MTGQKGKGGAKPGRWTVTVEGVRFGRPSDLTIRMEIGRCLYHKPKLTRVLSIPTRRILKLTAKRGSIATRRFPLPPNIERTGISSGDGVARQRAPVGDPLNDEQWSDNLLGPPSH